MIHRLTFALALVFGALTVQVMASELSERAQERILSFTTETDREQFVQLLLRQNGIPDSVSARELVNYVLDPTSDDAQVWAITFLESERADPHVGMVAIHVELVNQFADEASSWRNIRTVLEQNGYSERDLLPSQNRLLSFLQQALSLDLPVTKIREDLSQQYAYGITEPMTEEHLEQIHQHLYTETDLSLQEYWYLAQIYLGQRPGDRDFLEHVWNEGTYLFTPLETDRGNLMEVLMDTDLEEPVSFVLERLENIRGIDERGLPSEAQDAYEQSFAFVESSLNMPATREFVHNTVTVQPGRYFQDLDRLLMILANSEHGKGLLSERELTGFTEDLDRARVAAEALKAAREQ